MRASLPLVVSISLNVALAGVLLLKSGDDSPEPAATTSTGSPSDPQRVFKIAQEAGLGDSLAYRLALVAAQPSVQPAKSAQYWTLEGRSDTTLVLPQEGDDELRSRLVQAFGESARERPEFASLFKPFANKYPFLSSQKQLALQKIVTTEDIASAGGRASECGLAGCDPREKIRQLLTPAEYAEYELRESPVSHRLASTGVDFTEQEFRDAYQVLAEQPGPATDRNAQRAEQERRIESILGKEKFARYQRAQDPIYRALNQGGRKYSVGQEAIDSAYQLIKDSQHRMASADSGTRSVMRDDLNTQLQARIGPQLTELVSRYFDGGRAENRARMENVLLRATAAGRASRVAE
jgi:hypothetical protein